MINRVLIGTCLAAFFIILALNVVPLIWSQSPSTYIQQDQVSGMAIRYNNRLFTLNYEQQKSTIDILNRAIPNARAEATAADPKLDFDEIIIYRFDETPVVITPIAWVDRSLYFKAPNWSQTNLIEVSKGQLYQILSGSYDRKPYN